MRAGWTVSRVCAVHGESCNALGIDFAVAPKDVSTLYETVRMRLGGGVLVSSDKYPSYFERHLRRGQMLGVVLFKHPYRAVASDVLTNKRGFDESLNLWSADYAKILDWADTFCVDVTWLGYEVFATQHDKVIDALCSFAGVERNQSDDALASDYHFIGGNAPARNRNEISIDDKWQTFLTNDTKRRIDEHEVAQKVLADLVARAINV